MFRADTKDTRATVKMRILARWKKIGLHTRIVREGDNLTLITALLPYYE